MSRKDYRKTFLWLLGVLCLPFLSMFLAENVSAYNVSGITLISADYNASYYTPAGSHTYFYMTFYLDSSYVNATHRECYCGDPNKNNFMTSGTGREGVKDNHPIQSYLGGVSAYDNGSSVSVYFSSWDSSVQPIMCTVARPSEPTWPDEPSEPSEPIEWDEDGDWETDRETKKTRVIASETFTVDANTELTNVTGTVLTNGVHEVNAESATVDFRHTLNQRPSSNFNVNVSYGGDNLSGSTTVPNYSSSIVPGSKIDRTELVTNDSKKAVCQNINYTSKTWTYNIVEPIKERTEIRYRTTYSGGCSCSVSRTILEKRIITEVLGSPYIDTSSLRGFNDRGSSNDACAYLHRPWNFKVTSIDNNSSSSSSSSGEIVYAGDEIEPSFKINVVKNNENFSITDIPNATINLCAGIKDRETCTNVHTNKTVHAESGKIDSSTSYSYHNINSFNAIVMGDRIVVEDVPAGTEYCVRLSIMSTNSGNGYYSNFNWNPTYSERKCYIVAKKPMVQVWGGNIVSGGNIKSGFTKKLHGTYGSWDELAVVAGGQITGFASGASLAGGAKDATNNKLTALTLANANLTSYLGGDFNPNLSKIRKDKEAVLEKIETSYEVLNALPDSPVSGKKYVKVNGNLLIDKNIQYVESATTLDDMPKLFIYATGNINIRCDVTRIDAIIVADGTINTCTDNNGITPERDTRARSKQLMVNGMIIANELQLNRMYGAAAGEAYSAIPAEIINYDSLIELMTMEKVNDGRTGFNTVYTQESAVRY